MAKFVLISIGALQVTSDQMEVYSIPDGSEQIMGRPAPKSRTEIEQQKEAQRKKEQDQIAEMAKDFQSPANPEKPKLDDKPDKPDKP